MNNTSFKRHVVKLSAAVALTPIAALALFNPTAQAAPSTTPSKIVSNSNTSVQSPNWGAQTIAQYNKRRFVMLNLIKENDKKIVLRSGEAKKLEEVAGRQAKSIRALNARKNAHVKTLEAQNGAKKNSEKLLAAHINKMKQQQQNLNNVAETVSKVGLNIDGAINLIASTDPEGAKYSAAIDTTKTQISKQSSVIKTINTEITNQSQARNTTITKLKKVTGNVATLKTTNNRLKKTLPGEATTANVRDMDMVVPTFNSVAAMDEYADLLKANGLSMISVAAMKDPTLWPATYLPVPAGEGRWNYGVAQAKLGNGKSILIVPQETFNAIRTGLQQVGVPYVWGGTTTSGFDCSGLMLYMFSKENVYLPRVAAAQQSYGIKVDSDNMLPGDFIYSGSPAHHVTIYVGKDPKDGTPLMLEAPRTGLNVRVTSVRKITNLNRPTLN